MEKFWSGPGVWLSVIGVIVGSFLLGAVGATAVSGLAPPGPAPDSAGVLISREPPTSPADAVACQSSPSLCERGEEIASSIPYPWADLGYEIHIAPPPDDWHAGVSRHDAAVIELYVRDDSTRQSLERTLAHEIAHALHTVCSDRLPQWRERRGLDHSVPDHVPAPHDYDSVAEDFAEAFSQYLGFGTSRGTVGAPVTDEWLDTNADLFEPCV